MPSPTRDSFPSLLPPFTTDIQLNAPPSPRTHRTLRKLQSAHNLGATARVPSQPSLITQHRLRELHSRDVSPTRRQAILNRSPQRNRSNSDATPPNMLMADASISLSSKRAALSRTPSAADAMSVDRLVKEGPPPGEDVSAALESIRLKVLDQGIKCDVDGMSSSRIYVWLILLDAPILTTDDYLVLVHRSASPAYSKIRNDTFRTLTTDPLFRRRVSEASLIRLLNAIAWKLHDAKEERRPSTRPSSSRQSLPASNSGSPTRNDAPLAIASSPAGRSRTRAATVATEGSESGASEPGTYVQGMNVLAAPFLYAARSEAEAFMCFHQLLTRECPGYIRGAMDGVHRGLTLVDKVLSIVDSKLSLYLTSKGLTAEIYAFPSVLTLCACTPPLPEVLRLWDFLFAYGPHLNILCIVAQLVLMRNDLLSSSSPNKLLRSFPTLQADHVKRTALAMIRMIPDEVYSEIVRHAL
ncbi:rab-GTPase-TBC domain-containing protein [Xylariomycetidae sp. FL0641]|nr:rab-GTPase-TBC domain-containing protein [Xylariomycetidae sp. FL0641]